MHEQEVRERYFRDYKVKADEYLTEEYELVCISPSFHAEPVK